MAGVGNNKQRDSSLLQMLWHQEAWVNLNGCDLSLNASQLVEGPQQKT